jgi:predicted SAM-dependent methyltransferase
MANLIRKLLSRLISNNKTFLHDENTQIKSHKEIFSIIKEITVHELSNLLCTNDYFKVKIDIYNSYRLDSKSDLYILKNNLSKEEKELLVTCFNKSSLLHKKESITSQRKQVPVFDKIQYGSGSNFLHGWINVDLIDNSTIENYLQVDLTRAHPFKNDSFTFGFCEDFLEHLSQEDSIIFITEAFRTLKKNGVLRMSFPGLEGVLKKHYKSRMSPYVGKFEAYLFWDHKHFYSKEELKLVALNIGFRSVEFVNYGESSYDELRNLDTRMEQKELNTYIEMKK